MVQTNEELVMRQEELELYLENIANRVALLAENCGASVNNGSSCELIPSPTLFVIVQHYMNVSPAFLKDLYIMYVYTYMYIRVCIFYMEFHLRHGLIFYVLLFKATNF